MKRNRKISLFLSCATALPAVLLPLSACSKNNHVVDDIVVVENKSIITYEHSFAINFEFLIDCQQEVLVQITSPSVQAFWIKQNIIQLNKRRGTVEFQIDDSISVNSLFSYNLKFWFRTPSGEYHSETLFGFNTYFLDEHESELDFPYVEANTQTVVNKHKFQYKVIFEKEPTSKHIHIQLNNDPSNKISLETDVVDVQSELGFFFINVNVDLDMSVFLTSTYCFSIDIEFVNSYGREQRNHFYGWTAEFQKEWTDEIPNDYFNIVYSSNDEIILKGLKDKINKLESGAYSKLLIPPGVTKIDPSAFTDKEWFKNIRFLHIPKSVKSIGGLAFSGLDNLNELDLIDYSLAPDWSETDNIFDKDNFKTVGGFVWTDQIQDLDSFNTKVHKWGLPQLWNAYNSDMVSSEENFTLTNEGTVLNGIPPTTESYEKWKHIKVIKIPESVERISINSLNPLKEIPFEKNKENFDFQYETRRLILNKKLTNLPEHVFQNLGISGVILIYCDNLKLLPFAAFSDSVSYGSPALLDVENEPFNLMLSDSFNIENIEDFCFNMTPFANQNIVFPASVTSIGKFAFQGHQFQSITFTHYLSIIGNRAFSNIYAYPAAPTITSIDLSKYNVVLNPGADPVEWTYLPSWMETENHIFDGACVDDEQTHYVYMSQQLHDELSKKEGGFDKWFSNFLNKQSIPSSWKCQIK